MNFFKMFLAGLLAFVVGGFVTTFLWIFILVGLAGSMEKSVLVEQNSILKIDLEEEIVDAPPALPWSSFNMATMEMTPSLTLFKALRAIEAAQNDDRIKGIYLRLNGKGGASIAIAEELREAIVAFKKSGKFVVAYNEVYGQGGYYLASAADKIYLQPQGAISWQGLNFTLMFYKGLFDKLDIQYEVFRPTVCKYKSAVEPYFLTKMSDANREQMQQLVQSMWGTLSSAVAESRGIELAKLNALTDSLAVSEPAEALKNGFVDSLIYEDQMNDVFKGLGVEADSKGEYKMITLGEYAAQVSADVKNISASQIAIVYAQGAIVDGEGVGAEIYGNTLAKTIADVRKDDKIKAVVLRVNSPGGSALASDVIWREVELLKKEKPVIVSMGSYAASGGYYIACPADVIIADRTTLTGSIGVFGAFPIVGDLMRDKLGITFDGVKSNTSADMGSSVMGLGVIRPLNAAERIFIMKSIDKVYATFTGNVAAGRNLPIEKVLEIAGGRVWSGTDALNIGLIDSYGGLGTAISIAADKAGLGDKYFVKEITEKPEGIAAIFSMINAQVKAEFALDELGLMLKPYQKAQEMMKQQGVLMYCPYDIDVR
ncbi:MAG: signal peptide peptidase SppA [Alistipes sp.]